MGNPLLDLWYRMRLAHAWEQPHSGEASAQANGLGDEIPASGGLFLVLRRMRAPFIVLIVVFSVSVLGLTLIPGQSPDGSKVPMRFFEAFYFMSYTATTIGFGEIPHAFTPAQRMWVTFCIFLAVIGWAYAVGTLLALMQDRTFRQAISRQRFRRQVARVAEPFLLVVGYGDAGHLVVRALDRTGRRTVVVERAQDRVETLSLEPLRADVPGLAADGRVPANLQLAGLDRPRCEGVLALTDDDEANLAVVQAVDLLRPGLPVIARVESSAAARRMRMFGVPTLVNPFDAFGDRLRVTLRSPVTAQLAQWLSSIPGTPLQPALGPPTSGRWIVVGPPRVVHEVVEDLQRDGLPVTIVEPSTAGTDPADPQLVALASASVGLVAAADRDTLNLSYVEAARRANPELFVIARQEARANAPLFRALAPDLVLVLVPAEVAAREVIERLSDPALWTFLAQARELGDEWAVGVLDRLVARCGEASPTIWQAPVTAADAPALWHALEVVPVTLGALVTGIWPGPTGAVPLAVMRDAERTLTPPDEWQLRRGDCLLMAGPPGTRRRWDSTVRDEAAVSCALTGVATASTWWGRLILLRPSSARDPG